ncbi:MAG: hypothetical protein QOE92_361 [Chloroflexota bacterium]|nr:hypothetical protein [Chloroflexota bacterium]
MVSEAVDTGLRRAPGGRVAAVAPVGYVLLAFGLFAPTWVDPFHRVVGHPGDTSVFVWSLAWGAHAVTHLQNPLFTDYMNHPDGVNLMWNTSILLPSILLTPVTLALGPVFAYNLLATLALALSAWVAFVAIRPHVDRVLAAAAGGLLYGFSPYMVSQSAGHVHVTLALFPPLALILVREALVTQRRRPVLVGALLGLATAAQVLTGEEIAITTVMAAAVLTAWLVVLNRRRVRAHWRHAAVALAAAAVTAAAVLAVPLAFQFLGPQRFHGEVQAHGIYVTDLLNFVVPDGFQAIAPAPGVELSNSFTGNGSEWGAYLGVPLLALLLVTAAWQWRRPVARLAFLTGASLAVFSLGARLHVAGADTGIRLPYWPIDRLPVLGNILPARLSLFVSLAAAFLLAMFLDRALTAGPASRRAVAFAVAAVALVPVFPAQPYLSGDARTPAFFSSRVAAKVNDGDVLLVAPTNGAGSPDPMLWQADSGMRFRLTSGYFLGPDANGHAGLGPRASPMSDFLGPLGDGRPAPTLDAPARGALLAELSLRQVRGVVVGPMEHRADVLAFFERLLERPPDDAGEVAAWWLR